MQDVTSDNIELGDEPDYSSDDTNSDIGKDSIYIPDIIFNSSSTEDNQASRANDLSTQFTDGEKLYPGAEITKLQAVSMLTSWFTLHPGISKQAFDRLLQLLHNHILPLGNILLSKYQDQTLLSPTVVYHCCINDCVVFRDSKAGAYSGLSHCPKCNQPRCKSLDSHVPRKKFLHMPLETRLRRMFGQEHTAKLFQQHSNDQPVSSGSKISSIHKTSTWNDWYKANGIHHGDDRAVSFGLCTDGLNPFSKEKVEYSMWPIVLFPLNFPANVRKLPSSLMLVGIIPGPNKMKDINPYLGLNGLEMYDAHNKCTFTLQANILINILDYPGLNEVLHCQGTYVSVYTACSIFNNQGYCYWHLVFYVFVILLLCVLGSTEEIVLKNER